MEESNIQIRQRHQTKLFLIECVSDLLKDVGAASLLIHPCIDAVEQGNLQPLKDLASKPTWMHLMSLSIWVSGKYLEVSVENCKKILEANTLKKNNKAEYENKEQSVMLRILDAVDYINPQIYFEKQKTN
jgi:hypothetical protein